MNNLLVWLLQFFMSRQKWYRNYYLKSRHWIELRRRKKKEVYWCERCYRMPALWKLDTHHLTYKRLWFERLDDLQILCRKCHDEAERKIKMSIRQDEREKRKVKDPAAPYTGQNPAYGTQHHETVKTKAVTGNDDDPLWIVFACIFLCALIVIVAVLL